MPGNRRPGLGPSPPVLALGLRRHRRALTKPALPSSAVRWQVSHRSGVWNPGAARHMQDRLPRALRLESNELPW